MLGLYNYIQLYMENEDLPRKIVLKSDNKTWGQVQAFKVENGLKNNNEAVNKLIKKGLLAKDDA